MRTSEKMWVIVWVLGIALAHFSYANAALGPCHKNGAAAGGCPAECYRGCWGQVTDDTCDNMAGLCMLTLTGCGAQVDPDNNCAFTQGTCQKTANLCQ